MKQKKLSLAMGLPLVGIWMVAQQVAAAEPPSAGTILQSIPETPKTTKPDAEIIRQQSEQPVPSAADQGPALHVKAFRITGNSVFSEAQLLPLLDEYRNKDLTFSGLQEAAAVLKSHYRENGYFLAQVILPVQEIKDGVVELQIIEGRVGQSIVIMKPEARLKPQVALRYLDAMLPPGTHVTEQSIEKPLLLLNDLPGVTISSTLKPGVQPGETTLDIRLGDEGKRYAGDVQLDNWGNRNSGARRVTGTVEARNLSGYGDLLSLRLLYAEAKGTTLGRMSYTLPVGNYGTKLTASYSVLTYQLGGTFADLNADGDAGVSSVMALHPFLRSRNNNLFGMVGYDNKQIADRKFDGASEEERELNNIWFGVAGDFRDDLSGGALNTYNLNVTAGNLDNSTPDTAYDTDGRFVKLNAAYQRLQSLMENTSLLMSFSAQLANKNLAAVEQMSLGGPRGVRSHPIGEGAGDDALLATLELRRVIPTVKPFGGALQLSAFTDFGYVKLRHDPLPAEDNTRTLRSYGVGVNIGKQGDFLLRMDVAFQAGENSDDDNRSPRLWAQAVKWF